jgi:hypothetical protein
MDEALRKSGDYPNIALTPGTHRHAATGEAVEIPASARVGGGTCEPEQAIAATLGTPISADLRTALDFMRIWITDDAHLGESAISYEFEKAEGLRKLDAIEQAIAATLGRGECEDTWGYDPYAAFRCSECGARHTANDKRVIRFCYNCGRKVKR